MAKLASSVKLFEAASCGGKFTPLSKHCITYSGANHAMSQRGRGNPAGITRLVAVGLVALARKPAAV